MKFDKLKDDKAKSAGYIANEIEYICKNMPKRDPGSLGEKICCEYMADQLQDCSDDVKVEKFKVHPASFICWNYITLTFMLLAFVAYFFSSMLSIILIVIGLVPMFSQFIFYKTTFDHLYKSKTSHNVTAIKKPTGEVKRRILFNGHADATWEWTANYKFGGIAFGIQFVGAVLGAVYVLAIAIAKWVMLGGLGAELASGVDLYMGLAAFVFLPFWIACYFLSNLKVIVDGANDNLTGCYMGIAMLKALKDNNIQLENTEVGVIITGSEEAGLRGAKAWCEAHKDDFKDVETLILCYDTIHESNHLQVNRKDLNGFVKADDTASDLFLWASKSLGVKCKEGSVPFGATDSAAFNQGGFKCTGITALNHNLQPYYHTRYDSYDNLNEECIADCYAISLEALRLYDMGGDFKKIVECELEDKKNIKLEENRILEEQASEALIEAQQIQASEE